MKVRIKFQKYGAMKFVGHLDVMRYFQKLFRRADIDSEYSKGFSPHQIMSFAAPLGVGLTSDAEYLDIQLLSAQEPEVMIERMNEAITVGFRIIGYHPLLEAEANTKTVTAMSLVASADYQVSLKDGYSIREDITSQESFQKAFQEFLELPQIIMDKKTKKSEKEVDIKPMITMSAFSDEDYETKRAATLCGNAKSEADSSDCGNSEANGYTEAGSSEYGKLKASEYDERENKFGRPESVAEVYENGIKVYLQMDTGSAANLKPELVMEAFSNYLGVPYRPFAWQVHRLEVYTRDAVTGKLAALDQLER
ncbi:radical SAM-linked protein [Anaerotaenia torta]|uniref:TIGR03936 family radical SAM-associated protein n=1 Tax=Anaerotaenia torta TaxID=433293 RepID=UPI003D253860